MISSSDVRYVCHYQQFHFILQEQFSSEHIARRTLSCRDKDVEEPINQQWIKDHKIRNGQCESINMLAPCMFLDARHDICQ